MRLHGGAFGFVPQIAAPQVRSATNGTSAPRLRAGIASWYALLFAALVASLLPFMHAVGPGAIGVALLTCIAFLLPAVLFLHQLGPASRRQPIRACAACFALSIALIVWQS